MQLIRETNRLLMTIIALVFVAGIIIVLIGAYATYQGFTAFTEISFGGFTVKSWSIGVGTMLIGAGLMFLTFGGVLRTFEGIVKAVHIASPTETRNAERSATGKEAQSVRIVIHLPAELRRPTFQFGLLHVRDGKDEVPDHGPLINKEILFKDIDRLGNVEAVLEAAPHIGFQFKCYVDYKGHEFEEVKNSLEGAGFTQVSRGEGQAFRAWFILPGYPTYRTIDGFINNFYYPS